MIWKALCQSAFNRVTWEAFVLSRDEHLPDGTIAGRLNISVNMVEKHIGRALLLLRAELYDKRY